jgi:hypothetical protein
MFDTVRVYSSCTSTIHEGSASAAVSEFAAGVASDDYASSTAVCGRYVVAVVSEGVAHAAVCKDVALSRTSV